VSIIIMPHFFNTNTTRFTFDKTFCLFMRGRFDPPPMS